MTVTRVIGLFFGRIINAIVGALALSRVHPNVLTFIGLLINIWAAFLFAAGKFRWAGVVVIGAGLFDMVDGRVARETNRVTRFGGFFDSVLDRYSDLAIMFGISVYFLRRAEPVSSMAAFFAAIGMAIIPYARARAEAASIPCRNGLLERPERIILLSLGLLFNVCKPVVFILAVLTHVTVLQRVLLVKKATETAGDAFSDMPSAH